MYRYSLKIFLVLMTGACSRHYVNSKQDFKHFSVKEEKDSKKISDSAAIYKTKVDAETGRVVCMSVKELTKEGDESTLGNFVCDALYYCTLKYSEGKKPDLVLANRGGLRSNLPAGELKVSNIYELMPFENELVLLKLKGRKLGELLIHLKEKRHPFSGMKITGFNSPEENMIIGGEKLNNEKDYLVATSDYLANGGDGLTFLQGAEHVEKFSLKIRDAIIEYCDYLTSNRKILAPHIDGKYELAK
jgi:2',3'-cyclic-nucleotide 2'-phosphodiesterase (5'-nucleotidase family)